MTGRWQEDCNKAKAMVQGCWSGVQDPFRGDYGVLHWCGAVVISSRANDLTAPSHIDKKCPFAGDVSIRGRILTGKVVSTKMTRTIVIRRDYLHYVPKYSACYRDVT